MCIRDRSYIIFEFMQDKYMEQSVHLASLMQKQFRQTCRRACHKNRAETLQGGIFDSTHFILSGLLFLIGSICVKSRF